jgi:hypothetical protein
MLLVQLQYTLHSIRFISFIWQCDIISYFFNGNFWVLNHLLFCGFSWLQDSAPSEEQIQKLVSMGFDKVKMSIIVLFFSFSAFAVCVDIKSRC